MKRRSPPSRNRVNFPTPPTIDVIDVSVQCGRCRAPQAIPNRAVVFVCSACRCVNRVRHHHTSRERRMSFIDCDIGESKMIPNIATLFQLGDTLPGSSQSSIPICSVCLDGVGDMILENCMHGGICEECSRHIALNKAVGGSHCPKCRIEILQILRIGELHDDFAKARPVELPSVPHNSPPRVPPPVGFRKEKADRIPAESLTSDSSKPDL